MINKIISSLLKNDVEMLTYCLVFNKKNKNLQSFSEMNRKNTNNAYLNTALSSLF